MRPLHRALPFLALTLSLLAVSRLSPAQAPQFRIAGVVFNSITGNPVARCHLDASLAQRSRNPGPGRRESTATGVETDEHGRFSINLPSAGAWHLTASALGYVTQAYDEHGIYSSAVVLTANAPSFTLQFRLPPQARISGTVLDESGEAVRSATVGLSVKPLSGPSGTRQSLFLPRGFAQTDDRGSYEFAGLPPGDYHLSVQARPWYSSTAQQRPILVNGRMASSTSSASPAEPSLDVTYPQTWYPGVYDPAQAETVPLVAGEERHADFHLTPIPSLHLQVVPPPAVTQEPGQRPIPFFPVVERVDPTGSRLGQSQTIFTTNGSQGSIDIGGLSPGTYRVTLPGQNQANRSTVIQITEGSSRTLDLRASNSGTANITVRFEGDDEERPMTIELIDTITGQRYSPSGAGRAMPLNGRRGPQVSSRMQSSLQAQREISFQIPPGRYEVSTQSRSDTFLTGISAQVAEVAGRFLTVQAGDATLTLHTSQGRATVTGVATTSGKPCAGAAILLVPAGIDDARSFTSLVRDQSNTDGSFELEDVVPGEYILIAVDRGWHINWSDPTTLRSYLTHGIPLELGREKKLRQNIEAQSP